MNPSERFGEGCFVVGGGGTGSFHCADDIGDVVRNGADGSEAISGGVGIVAVSIVCGVNPCGVGGRAEIEENKLNKFGSFEEAVDRCERLALTGVPISVARM